jgi:hypothetical protein
MSTSRVKDTLEERLAPDEDVDIVELTEDDLEQVVGSNYGHNGHGGGGGGGHDDNIIIIVAMRRNRCGCFHHYGYYDYRSCDW